MPMIMSLEGPKPDRLAELRGQLYAATPKTFWRASVALQGLFDPWRISWPLAIGAFVFGAWLGGSARGQRIVGAARRR